MQTINKNNAFVNSIFHTAYLKIASSVLVIHIFPAEEWTFVLSDRTFCVIIGPYRVSNISSVHNVHPMDHCIDESIHISTCNICTCVNIQRHAHCQKPCRTYCNATESNLIHTKFKSTL